MVSIPHLMPGNGLHPPPHAWQWSPSPTSCPAMVSIPHLMPGNGLHPPPHARLWSPSPASCPAMASIPHLMPGYGLHPPPHARQPLSFNGSRRGGDSNPDIHVISKFCSQTEVEKPQKNFGGHPLCQAT